MGRERLIFRRFKSKCDNNTEINIYSNSNSKLRRKKRTEISNKTTRKNEEK